MNFEIKFICNKCDTECEQHESIVLCSECHNPEGNDYAKDELKSFMDETNERLLKAELFLIGLREKINNQPSMNHVDVENHPSTLSTRMNALHHDMAIFWDTKRMVILDLQKRIGAIEYKLDELIFSSCEEKSISSS